jgi:hypothetical protein
MVFNSRKQLETHMKKKKPCQIVNIQNDLASIEYGSYGKRNDFQCIECGKKFISNAHLIRHKNAKMSDCAIQQLQETIVQLQKKQVISNEDMNNFNVNVDKTIITSSPAVLISDGERVDHITKDIMLNFLQIEGFAPMCCRFVEEIYFNPKVQENHSWFILYIKDDTGAISYDHEHGQLMRRRTEDVINEKYVNMLNLIHPMIKEIFEENATNNELKHMQSRNLERLNDHYVSQITLFKEDRSVFETIRRFASNFREIPIKTFKNQGLSCGHLGF